jgi:diguanylate cyclase (GGDEF)-like protein
MRFQSLKTRFMILGVLLMIVAVGFRLFFALPFAQEQLRELVESQQLSIANYIARDIDSAVSSQRDQVSEIARQLPMALLARPAELNDWLGERQRLAPVFRGGYVLIRPDGSTLAEYPLVRGREQLQYAERDWFSAVLATGKTVISKPMSGRLSGNPLLIMAAPVRNAEQRVVAVLAGVVQLSAPGFLDRLQEHKLGDSGGFLLISPQDRVFVGSSNPAMIMKPTPAAGLNALHDRAMGGFRGTGITTNAKGIEEISAIASVPTTGWFVVARMPTDEAFRPVYALRDFLLKSSAIMLVLMLVFLMFSLPHLLRPLTDTARAMREMADGTRDLEPLPVRRRDEMGDLVLGFNYLVARLREKDTALRASEAHMAFIAHHDTLTGLFNRNMLEDRLQQAIARSERDERHFALLFVDLDHFKPINDDFGHGVGDAVLVEVAARLSHGRRRVDTVARHGGDEFVILLTDLDDARIDADTVARHYLQVLAEPFFVDGRSFHISASIGIALYTGEPLAGSQLMSRADVAMYQAKRSGKNTRCFFGDSAPSTSVAHAANQT